MIGIIILKNSLDDMLCEQIEHLGPKAMVWLKQMMNYILVSKKFPKLWRKSKLSAILKTDKDSSLHKNYRPISLLNPITEHTIIKEQAGFRAGNMYKPTDEPGTVYREWIREESYHWHCICGPVCCVCYCESQIATNQTLWDE